jgi:hypothetical protein
MAEPARQQLDVRILLGGKTLRVTELSHSRTRTGRIRCFVFSCVRRSYLEKSLRYATIAEAKRQGVYGTGGRYIEEDEPR